MNSDFMQQQGELLARRVASEPTTAARIEKAYRLVFGRAPTDAERRAGLEYLAAEPMRAYEERRAEKDAKNTKSTKEMKDGKDTKGTKDAKETQGQDAKSDESAKTEMSADGMMAGVVPGAGKKDDAKKLLPVTTWGRYAKILLSSSEFLFVN